MSNEGNLCPSAPWTSQGGKLFGVVGGDLARPKVLFLKQVMVPDKALEEKLGDVHPDKVFRVAAPCAGGSCSHHNAQTRACNLVSNIVEQLDPVVDNYATCGIRANCLWWAQEGVQACVRCPQVATLSQASSQRYIRAVTPESGRRPDAAIELTPI